VSVSVDDRELGRRPADARLVFPLPPHAPRDRPPVVRLATAAEGTWLVVEEIRLLARVSEAAGAIVARWTPDTGRVEGRGPADLRLTLDWCPPEEIALSSARFATRDCETRGDWTGKLGARAAWIPHGSQQPEQNGYRLEVIAGKPFTWAPAVDDPRVLRSGATRDGDRRSTCWFEPSAVSLSLTPPDREPYRLTAYLLDYDRNGRAMEVSLAGALGPLDARRVSAAESGKGIHLTWEVRGPVRVYVRKRAGYNAVISGVFVDGPR
jgi:hypothetical protein